MGAQLTTFNSQWRMCNLLVWADLALLCCCCDCCSVAPSGNLERGLVSCTGSQFCGFALIETKQRAMQLVAQLEAQLHLPQPVRIHWTGCPNSCGQAQVADIGLMGAPAKLNGKAVEGVKIFLGGKVGENPALADQIEAGVPCHEDHLVPKLRELLVEHFGATPIEQLS
jgi:ferredoxin-nitrite reductase